VSAPDVVLTMITDRHRAGGLALPRLAEEAARAGADLIQVREKDLDGGALRTLVGAVLAATQGTATRVLVNGRVDVAVSAGASGVQLPEDGLGVADVKRSFPHLMIGASRHSLDGVKRAEAEGADFVLFGPVWSTPGKESRAVGVAALRRATSQVRIPVHAVGGLDPGNAREAVEAGAAGIAAIRPFVSAPASAVEAFREALR
jgi:thiamine-phosphate pyrophosphorylase